MVGMMSIETTKKTYYGLLIQGRKLIALLMEVRNWT